METVINAIAVVFVTSMIIWMNGNAAQVKGELERGARQAINRGGALALAAMAFLAVLKEGFETSVFLLAAAETSHGNRWFAVLGGVLGIAAAIAMGVGVYFGGLKLNLARFFRVTGVFLILIAAGLVLGALRTAHEAGWVSIGQQRVLDLSAWIPSNSVLGAVTAGMLGIPADPPPRRGGGLAALCGAGARHLPVARAPCRRPAGPVPTTGGRHDAAAPCRRRTGGAGARRRHFRRRADPHRQRSGRPHRQGVAGPRAARPHAHRQPRGQLRGPQDPLTVAGDQTMDGVWVRVWQATLAPEDNSAGEGPPDGHAGAAGGHDRGPATGGCLHLPQPRRLPGAVGHHHRVHGARARRSRCERPSGQQPHRDPDRWGAHGGQTVSVGGLPTDWSTAGAEDQWAAAQIAASHRNRAEAQLWKVWLPLALGGFALACAVGAVASLRRRDASRTGKENG